jgi:hypothetical protein
MSQPTNPGFRVFDPAEPDTEYDFRLTDRAEDRPFADAIDDALTDIGADLTN